MDLNMSMGICTSMSISTRAKINSRTSTSVSFWLFCMMHVTGDETEGFADSCIFLPGAKTSVLSTQVLSFATSPWVWAREVSTVTFWASSCAMMLTMLRLLMTENFCEEGDAGSCDDEDFARGSGEPVTIMKGSFTAGAGGGCSAAARKPTPSRESYQHFRALNQPGLSLRTSSLSIIEVHLNPELEQH